MHGNSNENQRNKMIDRPHLGKTTFSFLFFSVFFFWVLEGGGGGGGGGRGRGVMSCGMDLFKLRIYES